MGKRSYEACADDGSWGRPPVKKRWWRCMYTGMWCWEWPEPQSEKRARHERFQQWLKEENDKYQAKLEQNTEARAYWAAVLAEE